VNPLIADNFSIIHGKHTFKTGVRFSSIDQFQSSDANIWPNITVNQNNGNAAPGSIGPVTTGITSRMTAREAESHFEPRIAVRVLRSPVRAASLRGTR
jgi:hypothetical protein